MIKRYIAEKEMLVKDFLLEKGFTENISKELKNGNGQILVNDQSVENWYQIKPNDLVEIVLPTSNQGENIISTKHDFEILYEDSYILIINKENNLASIPTRNHYANSLSNYVMSYYKRKGIRANIHCIGRLDYATSGIIMFAKNPYIADVIKKQQIDKKYILEVQGLIPVDKGIITNGIKKDPTSIIKRIVTDEFINSKTSFEVLDRTDDTTLVMATLHTGKTHQLRLHFANLGFPIIGDELYGTPTTDQILHLHSAHLEFTHPVTGEIVSINSRPKWEK